MENAPQNLQKQNLKNRNKFKKQKDFTKRDSNKISLEQNPNLKFKNKNRIKVKAQQSFDVSKTEPNFSLNYKENQTPNQTNQQKNQNKQKLLLLFDNMKAQSFDFRLILQQWCQYEDILNQIKTNKKYLNELNQYFLSLNFKMNQEFLYCFSHHKNIQQKIQVLQKQFFWSLAIFVYNNQNQKILPSENQNFFEIFQIILNTFFYICVVLCRLKQEELIKIESNILLQFIEQTKKYEFENKVGFFVNLDQNLSKIDNLLKNIFIHSQNQNFWQFQCTLSQNQVDLKTFLKQCIQILKNNEDCNNQVLSNKNYTLVLDLDETLIHFAKTNEKSVFMLRPHLKRFIQNVSQYYEIMIFTAAQKEYADYIVNRFDKQKIISKRFYRDSCMFSDTAHVKDLNFVNRDLSKTIIVDNFPQNFQNQQKNGLHIKCWRGDQQDTTLLNLEKELLQIACSNVQDVRLYMQDKFHSSFELGFVSILNQLNLVIYQLFFKQQFLWNLTMMKFQFLLKKIRIYKTNFMLRIKKIFKKD